MTVDEFLARRVEQRQAGHRWTHVRMNIDDLWELLRSKDRFSVRSPIGDPIVCAGIKIDEIIDLPRGHLRWYRLPGADNASR